MFGSVRVAAASDRCKGVGAGRAGGAEGRGGGDVVALFSAGDVESSFGAVRPGHPALEHQGFMPALRPSQPPHSGQIESSLDICATADACVVMAARATSFVGALVLPPAEVSD